MKKIVALLFIFAICVSLCACGGMPGEKAALLYPDIIGEWGTDPFEEEFVLTLSEDGTCSILGHEGTWKLNTKGSNEESVELTVTTEAMKYCVELDRARDGVINVPLRISNTKKTTTIYRDEVFTRGTGYTFAEQAIPLRNRPSNLSLS